MALLWKDDYSTGMKQLDEQHKVLFNNINKLEKIIRKGSGAELIGQLFGFLKKYAAGHFATEEKYMEQYNCPVAERNKEAHRRFVMMFEKFEQRIAEEETDQFLLEQIHSSLETWLLNHVCEIDVNLKTSIEASSPS